MGNKLRIIGAGPGDPELLTLKAARTLGEADVIIYDALANIRVMDLYASATCKRVFVGKRKTRKELTQDEINRLNVFYAMKFRNVVRLKGGDPFVFGRGHEEMEYAMRSGIETEIIPGISSALAAPSSAGIPLTKRGVNQSFWVVTGSTACGNISPDVQYAARSTATVVVLMGISHLAELTSLFAQIRGDDEPVAIIQSASCAEQLIIKGTVKNILLRGRDLRSGLPGVIIFGNVVNESRLIDSAGKGESEYIHTYDNQITA